MATYTVYEILRQQDIYKMIDGQEVECFSRISYYLVEDALLGEFTSPTTGKKYNRKFTFGALRLRTNYLEDSLTCSPFEPRNTCQCSAPDINYCYKKYTLDADKEILNVEKFSDYMSI